MLYCVSLDRRLTTVAQQLIVVVRFSSILLYVCTGIHVYPRTGGRGVFSVQMHDTTSKYARACEMCRVSTYMLEDVCIYIYDFMIL